MHPNSSFSRSSPIARNQLTRLTSDRWRGSCPASRFGCIRGVRRVRGELGSSSSHLLVGCRHRTGRDLASSHNTKQICLFAERLNLKDSGSTRCDATKLFVLRQFVVGEPSTDGLYRLLQLGGGCPAGLQYAFISTHSPYHAAALRGRAHPYALRCMVCIPSIPQP